MTKSNFLIYGSYGFSGNLIAEEACRQGFSPILAGRNKNKLATQAKRLGLNYRVFDLSDAEAVKAHIHDVVSVIHCAGPFINTYQPMVEACLDTKTHYLDITGEYAVFERVMLLDQKAKHAEIMLLPGAGFDVVPSDCLAQLLKSRLPDASELALAIHTKNPAHSAGISRGTAKTAATGLANGARIRDQGKLQRVPLAFKKRLFHFDEKPITCMTIAWGDISTAWWSTRIPHIETYMSAKNSLIWLYRWLNLFRWMFKFRFINAAIEKKINQLPEGPTNEALTYGKSYVAGEIRNAKGNCLSSSLSMPNGYRLTALSAVLIVKKVLAGMAPCGYQTPSTAYGKDLIFEIQGVTLARRE